MSKNALRWSEEELATVMGARPRWKDTPLGPPLPPPNNPIFSSAQMCIDPPKKPRGDPEHQEQAQFIAEIEALAKRDTRYALAVKRTFAIANGGFKSKRVRGRQKAEGVRRGVYDLMTMLPVGGFHGLEIEMKSLTGCPSRDQIRWGSMSTKLGYCSAVCRGWKQAMTVWLAYVDGSL